MRFDLDGLTVYFPYDRMYLEQYQYMRALKRALDAGGHGLLEMPAGAGKTTCLLSLITSYQWAHPGCGKLVYCTRTVPEMNSVMEELGRVLKYRAEQVRLQQTHPTPDCHASGNSHHGVPDCPASGNSQRDDDTAHTAHPGKRKREEAEPNGAAGTTSNAGPIPPNGGAGGEGTLAVCLSSRRNMCINAQSLDQSEREAMQAACSSLTSRWIPEQKQSPPPPPSSRAGTARQYFDGNWLYAGVAATTAPVAYDLEELKRWGAARNWCPHDLTRQVVQHASVLVVNYQYMLYPKVAKMVAKELAADSVVVFDEGHNIDRVCLEAFSVTIQSRQLEQATRSLGKLAKEIQRLRASDGAPLQGEYEHLVAGLVDQGLLDTNPDEVGLASNVLSPDVLHEAVPGNIRRAEHFIVFMKKIVEHLKARLRTVAKGGATNESPLSFLHRLVTSTALEAKTLKFAHSRLSSLLRTLRVPNLDAFAALLDVADFAALVATYSEGTSRFAIVMEPRVAGGPNPGIHLACLDSALAIAPVFERFKSVIITSGTLSPLDLYPKLLQFEPCIAESFTMSTVRPCLHPVIITRGSDQLPVSTKFQERCDMGVVRNYGTMMIELCRTIPDGIVAFFTSYAYMEAIVSEWDGMGILRQLTKTKLVFIETEDVVETTLALENFRRACDSGRGAVFLSVARGQVSEGVNFDRHYGRAVIMFGVPFQYTVSHILRARLEYLQTHYQIREQDFLNFDALRQVAQCVGRVVRSNLDYGLLIFADTRYNRQDKRGKLPKWILQFLGEGQVNLSTDMAIGQVKHFLRVMAQPVDQNALKEVLLTVEEVETLLQCQSDIPQITSDAKIPI